MTDHVKLATERVLKTRTDVILTNRFYGVLVSNVEAVLSKAIPTAATNGKQHFFNPEFVNALTTKELKFVQRHESEHDARHHSTRRGGRDAKEWNIACDYAINIDLVDEIAAGDHSMELPNEKVLGGKPYVDAKYRGMSAEDIYRSRELDRQRAEQEKAKQPPQGADTDPGEDDDEGDASDDAGNEETGDEADHGDSNDDEDGDSGNADDEDGDEAGEETGGDAGEEAGSEAGDEAGDSGDQSDDQAGEEGSGDQSDDDGDADGDEAEGDAEGGNGEGGDEGEAGAEPKSATGDMPGGMGEVLDATDDPNEASEEEAKWERVVRQAATIGKGDMPGHFVREIDRANQSKQDWREVLRAYFDQGATQIETWNRLNRRFAGGGLNLPGSQREGVNEVVFLIDTSGSVDDIALDMVGAETQAALDEGIINKLTVVTGDTRVTGVFEYVPGDQIDFTANGRGGTAMRPLFDWVRENVDNPSLIVTFTDGFIESEEALGERPACPVLWAMHGYPDVVRDLIAKAPWGEPGIDVGAH